MAEGGRGRGSRRCPRGGGWAGGRGGGGTRSSAGAGRRLPTAPAWRSVAAAAGACGGAGEAGAGRGRKRGEKLNRTK